MWFDKIILLLSNHRQPNNPTIPMTLTKQQIVSLLRSSGSPNSMQERSPLAQAVPGLSQTEIQQALTELQARGEVYAGIRNRYCMTPPTVLTQSKDNPTGLRFRGDRAYLPLAHQALKTEQSRDDSSLHPKIHGFDRINTCLNQVGIRLITVADSIEYLPPPCQPSKAILRSPWLENPFQVKNWSDRTIQQYVPRRDTSQKKRWTPLSYHQLQDKALLQLPTGEYLWFQDQTFYELEPDTAILAMFDKDRETDNPLKIPWDIQPGRLNLQGTILPSLYAQLLWRLSEPDSERYRHRLFENQNHPFVEIVFQRLGCILV
ncbi:hypothetical protein WA1_16690 [Scytonema hofmannii PCC 7110]|uniref:Uncharacterized protein n=1 Tax=Scytonema hofmannii PCC 7110 TaxID=128403 RepID=A0A139XAF1_9CYAN|nr:hypothetical protein [Scytonema hofmannii]KYC41677.1 hypothetical protein WA1_16690 [Scytonema hofmannii PCC 7110]